MGSSPTKLTGAYYAGVGRGPFYEDDLFFAQVLSGGNTLAVAAVADGMGDGLGGLHAAQTAIGVVKSLLLARLYSLRGRRLSELELGELLKESLQKANAQVLKQSIQAPMGATLTVAVFTDEFIILGHVGDCRAYRLSDGQLERLTQDHAVGIALTRRLGKDPTMQIDLRVEAIAPGQIYILCSNGLHGQLGEDEITRALETTPTLADGCVRLACRALAKGGAEADSASIVGVEVGQYPRRPEIGSLAVDELALSLAEAEPVAEAARQEPPPNIRAPEPPRFEAPPRDKPPARRRDRTQMAALLGLGLLAMLALALLVLGVLSGLQETQGSSQPEAPASFAWPKLLVGLIALGLPVASLLWWRMGGGSKALRQAFERFRLK